LGALLLGKYEQGGLVYVGRVGTGFTDQQLRDLRKQLQKMVIAAPAATIDRMSRVDQKLAIWVQPRLVVEAYFQGIGSQGLLRQPAFKALRPDKSPADLDPTAAGDGSAPPASKKAAKTTAARARSSKAGKSPGSEEANADSVVITHPEREVFPGTGITKADVAAYYRTVARWIVPETAGRPLSVVRCPAGAG